jgi:flavin-dependent dehydrogenase
VGDAAGAVDPITREGIHHALETGARLGEFDPLARPGRYAAWYDAELRPELVRSAQLARTFFRPRFLTTMIRALDRSEALRDLFRDLVAGTQSYLALRRRLLASLPRTLGALFVSALKP